MQLIPTWRSEPEPVLIKIKIVGTNWSGQILAEFIVGGETYVATVDEDLIDKAQNKMRALIIADIGASNYLVDLPGESLSAGSRIVAGAKELERINGR